MSLPRWSDPFPGRSPESAARHARGGTSEQVDWEPWLRSIEQKRRLLSRSGSSRPPRYLSPDFYHHATFISFGLEGLATTREEINSALSSGARGKAFRTRQRQRIRHHVAALRSAQRLLRQNQPLQSDTVVRWYASISCGLCTARLDEHTLHRLDQTVRQVNSPAMRLRTAVENVACLHQRLLSDPFVPAFNGILARLLLHYHLGRSGLPCALLDPVRIPASSDDGNAMLRWVMAIVFNGFDRAVTAINASHRDFTSP